VGEAFLYRSRFWNFVEHGTYKHMFRIHPRLSLHTAGFPVSVSDTEVRWLIHGSTRTTFSVQEQVPQHHLMLERSNLLSRLLPQFAVEEIMSYHHEWCYNKVFLRLLNARLLKGFSLPSGPISVDHFLRLLKLNSLCSFYMVNGNEVLLHRTDSSKSFCVWIRDEDVEVLDFARGVNPFRKKSAVVHGRPEFLAVVEYLKVMQTLMHHFGHSGRMRTPYIPARDNLNRTTYEVMMICLKEYAFDLAGIKIFWKVDPKRFNRVQKLKQEVCEPALMLKAENMEKTFFYSRIVEKVVLKENVEVFPDKDFEERQQIIQENEQFQMELEDFPAGDEAALEKLHCRVHVKKSHPHKEKWKHKVPKKDEVKKTSAELRYARYQERRRRQGEAVITRTVIPEATYEEYLQPKPHGLNPFNTPRVRKYLTEERVKEVQTHDPNTQERWQATVNLEMDKVLLYGKRADYNLRVNISLPWEKHRIPGNRRDRDPQEKLNIVESHINNYEPRIAPRIRQLRTKREAARRNKIRELKKTYPDHSFPKELVEQYTLKLLFYVFYVFGATQGVACLTHQQMLRCIECVGNNHKIPAMNNGKKNRFRKRDRKFVRIILKKLFV
jgi:hypothetical protein